MAFQTGTATSQEDLIGKLYTFATGQGWTGNVNSTTNDWAALNNGAVYVQFRWDNSAGIGVFHSLGFVNTSTAPGNHTNDSGAGQVDASTPYNAAITGGRRIAIGNGPYVRHWFFTDGTTKYVHCVVEETPGKFRHFGFGSIDKVGSWTGGEYAYGHRWAADGAAASDDPLAQGAATAGSGHNVLFDWLGGGSGSSDAAEAAGTLHVEGVTGQPAGSKWALFCAQSSSLGTDRAGNARFNVRGGVRGGPHQQQFGAFPASLANGSIPLVPVGVWLHDATVNPATLMLLGSVADLRTVQMRNIVPAQEFTVGSDTWMVFPLDRKQWAQADTEESGNAGIAYRKVP